MNNLLLVEGPDDVHVVSQLLNEHGLTRLRNDRDRGIKPLKLLFDATPLNIIHVADIDDMIGQFETTLTFGSDRSNVVGLILDFDAPSGQQANNRDAAICDAILRLQGKGNHWTLPDSFDTVLMPDGFIAEPSDQDTPRIGVWLMPNNQDRGMLETFLQQLIPTNRADLLKHAQSVTRTAKKDHSAPFKDVHRDKAIIHTFLAWMDEPGKPFGISFQNRSFDANADLANRFVGWLKRLYR